ESDPEILAGPVRVLRHGRPAADEQRPGATLREPPVPRAAGHGSQGGVARPGAAGLGPTGSRDGNPAAGGDRVGPGRGGSGPVEETAGRVRRAAAAAGGPAPVSPRSGGLPPGLGGQAQPARLAAVEKNYGGKP